MIEVEKMNFAGKDYIVMDKFAYAGKTYLCLYEDVLNKIHSKETIIVDFVFKCDDGMYENVVDDELYEKLISIEGERQFKGENKVYNFYQEKLKK